MSNWVKNSNLTKGYSVLIFLKSQFLFQARFHEVFEPYGLVYGVQVFPSQIRPKAESGENQSSEGCGGYYAFVTFYSSQAAAKAKEDLNSVLLLEENECKVHVH